MSGNASRVSARVRLHLVAPADLVPVDTEMRYDPSDPYAVTVRMSANGAAPIEWVVAREVLSRGLSAPAGDGDLGVWPSAAEGHPVLCMALSSPDGQALLVGERDEVERFLERTYAQVRPGRESQFLDMDGLVHQLLRSA